MLFGLVPASIVAWFAYTANDDYKEKQTLIVQQDGRSDQLPRSPPFMQQDPKTAETGARGKPSGRRAEQIIQD